MGGSTIHLRTYKFRQSVRAATTFAEENTRQPFINAYWRQFELKDPGAPFPNVDYQLITGDFVFGGAAKVTFPLTGINYILSPGTFAYSVTFAGQSFPLPGVLYTLAPGPFTFSVTFAGQSFPLPGVLYTLTPGLFQYAIVAPPETATADRNIIRFHFNLPELSYTGQSVYYSEPWPYGTDKPQTVFNVTGRSYQLLTGFFGSWVIRPNGIYLSPSNDIKYTLITGDFAHTITFPPYNRPFVRGVDYDLNIGLYSYKLRPVRAMAKHVLKIPKYDSEQGFHPYFVGLANAHAVKLKMEISIDMKNLHKILTPLLIGDPIQAFELLVNTMRESYQSLITMSNLISESSDGQLKVISDLMLNDKYQSVQALQNSLVSETQAFLKTINSISMSADGRQFLLNFITEESLQEISKLNLVIDDAAVLQQVAKLSGILGDPSDFGSPIESTMWDIFIDGISIKKSLKFGEITINEEQIHNTITLNFAGDAFFDMCDTSIYYGQPRIEIQVGSRALYFLIEERSGKESEFSVWGRSLTALEDVPYKEKTSYFLNEPKLASEVAFALAGSRVLDWQTHDWLLPKGFQYVGTPIDGLSLICDQIGAVLRSQDDGSFLVRDKYPVRPIDAAQIAPTVQYSRFDNMIELSFKEEQKLPYNSVPVNGITFSANSPIIEVHPDDNTLIIGQNAYVRVYLGDFKAYINEVFTTAGLVSDLGKKMHTEIVEFIVLSEGAGQTRYYINDLVSVEWIGMSGGAVQWEQFSRDLAIDSSHTRIAKVTYQAEYRHFLFTNHYVEMLNAVFSHHNERDVAVAVSIGEGDSIAPLITKDYLTTEAAAVHVGTAWIDDNLYKKDILTVTAPYRDSAIDGNMVLVSNERIRIEGNGKLNSASIVFNGIKIHNKMEVTLWPGI